MKSLIIIILTAAALYAGRVCVDVPPAHEARVAEAFGNILNTVDANGSPRPATQPEVANATQAWLQGQVQDYERRKNQVQFAPSPLPMTVSISPAPSPTAVAVKAAAPTPKK